ncbi:hypothetical protein [Paenibacillus sp. OAS669]|uniref:hypothetical protein n=1 Tax=Paenibacillus sp. OAS669 TaxID=2663821 RepID=UPI00178B8EA6|nr:hypothetical protein [Paenibacillus sp. OAS669]MBE1445120.1 photosystem II stability/assembly factor-like uncharacterized protein [Paenibacillus sp. OAS669]
MTPKRSIFTFTIAGSLLLGGCQANPEDFAVQPTALPKSPETAQQSTNTSTITPVPAQTPQPSAAATPEPAITKSITTEALPLVTVVPSSTPGTAVTPAPASSPVEQILSMPPQQSQTGPIAYITGMGGNEGYGVSEGKLMHTWDSGKSWELEEPDGVSEEDQLLKAEFQNPMTGFAFYRTASGQILVTHPTEDGSGTRTGWETTPLPITEAWEGSPDVTVQSNANYFDASYVLVTSSPALGQMYKMLYKTSDRGKSWSQVGDITDKINGYPTGLSFRVPQEGWITATYHGPDTFPLFRTKDGGKTWSLQHVEIPDEFKDGYANTLPPVFDIENNNHGLFIAEFVKGENRAYVLYESRDSGDSWQPLPYRLKDVQAPPVLHFDLLINGRAISADGKTIYTMDVYNKEDWKPIETDTNLEETEQFFLRSDGYGWMLRKGQTIITQDGGQTWTEPE